MAQFTEHYGLHQWEPEDNFQREDFNGDNEKIDTAIEEVKTSLTQALATKSSVAFGSYTGTGSASRMISLGFTPKAVILVDKNGYLDESNMYGYHAGGIAVQGGSCNSAVAIVSGGFMVYCDERRFTNMASYGPFSYIAFR